MTRVIPALPKHFSLQMPDDAMAPAYPVGGLCHFDRDRKPIPDNPVLVMNKAGVAFVRVYREAAEGRGWFVEATNPRYAGFDGELDGLIVLGVMFGFAWAAEDGTLLCAVPETNGREVTQ